MSPEDALRGVYGPCNDIWAVGMLMLFYFKGNYYFFPEKREEVEKWFKQNPRVCFDNVKMPPFTRKLISCILIYDEKLRPTASELIRILDPADTVISGIVRRPEIELVPGETDTGDRYGEMTQSYIAAYERAKGAPASDLIKICCREMAYMLLEPWGVETTYLAIAMQVKLDVSKAAGNEVSKSTVGNEVSKAKIEIKNAFTDILKTLDYDLWYSVKQSPLKNVYG
jgi:hypothetical protein